MTCALWRQVKARMQSAHEQEHATLRDALRRSERMRDDDVATWSREVHALKTQLSEDKAAWSMQRDLEEYADALRRMQEAELQAAVNLDYMCGWATSPNASPQSGWSRDHVVSSTRTSPHSRMSPARHRLGSRFLLIHGDRKHMHACTILALLHRWSMIAHVAANVPRPLVCAKTPCLQGHIQIL